MKKIYAFVPALLCTLFLQAQTTTASVNFTAAVVANTTTVNFTNTSKNLGEGTKKAWWSFGDGTTAVTGPLEGTRHHYAAPGTYQPCLKIYRYPSNSSDSVLIGAACQSLTIARPATADECKAGFTVQSQSATAMGRRFVAQAAHNKQKKPLRVCWKFGDGKEACTEYAATYSGEYVAEHVYAQPGQYEACVIIRYDGGCESRQCQVVSIAGPPPPPVCEVSLHAMASAAANLDRRFLVGLQDGKRAEKVCWKFGDGSDTCVVLSQPLNPQQLAVEHRYPAPGNYAVCVRVFYAGGCVAEQCRVAEIAQPAGAICGGYITDSVQRENKVRFGATGIHPPGDQVVSYRWNFGDGTTASQRQVTHTYPGPGTYQVCLVMATLSGCETRICKKVVVPGQVKPQLVLSPTMATSTITAVFQSVQQQPVKVSIYNGNGVLMRSVSQQAVVGTNTWTFNVGGLPAGVYSVVVQSATQFATAVFFKQ